VLSSKHLVYMIYVRCLWRLWCLWLFCGITYLFITTHEISVRSLFRVIGQSLYSTTLLLERTSHGAGFVFGVIGQ